MKENMKQNTIEIFLFIDALGWKIVNDHTFMEELLPYRKSSFMQFGYSCSAMPTILSGKTPAEHGHLGLFRFSLNDSPFKMLSRISWLFKPAHFWNRGRVRHHLSKIIKKLHGFTGYFQLYQMPLEKLKYMDYCEKQDLFVANGMYPLVNLHDRLVQLGVPFHISDWHLSDDENYLAAERAIAAGKRFLFVYTASLDGLLHDKVGDFQAVDTKLSSIKCQIEKLYAQAKHYAEDVHFTVFSDHGMTPLTRSVEVMSTVGKTGLRFGKDYGVCYDSTMARFYYLRDDVQEIVETVMKDFPGHFLTIPEEKRYGIYRADRLFGDQIFLCDAGVQLAPSDMGGKPLAGMHGFAPEDVHSEASILSNVPIPAEIVGVADYFDLMMQRAEAL